MAQIINLINKYRPMTAIVKMLHQDLIISLSTPIALP